MKELTRALGIFKKRCRKHDELVTQLKAEASERFAVATAMEAASTAMEMLADAKEGIARLRATGDDADGDDERTPVHVTRRLAVTLVNQSAKQRKGVGILVTEAWEGCTTITRGVFRGWLAQVHLALELPLSASFTLPSHLPSLCQLIQTATLTRALSLSLSLSLSLTMHSSLSL